jgi:flagellar biosynthesis/type III secretory pathway ATPase
MRIVHVKTTKINGYDQNGLITEVITQKVRSNGTNDEFEQLCAIANATGYKSLEVVNVLDIKTKKPVDEVAEFQKIVDQHVNPVEEEVDLKTENESLKAQNESILKRLEALESKDEGGPKDDDKEYRQELKDEIEDLQGKPLKGGFTIEVLERKRDELLKQQS